jgi:hypothetical protein
MLVESTHDTATYRTHRVGEPEPVTISFTAAQAKAAGLSGKDTWQKHPDAMLRARAASSLARAVYPDLILGIYTEDEAEEIPFEPVNVTPPKPKDAEVTSDQAAVREMNALLRLLNEFASAVDAAGLGERIRRDGKERPSRAAMKEFIAALLDTEPWGEEETPTAKDIRDAIDVLPHYVNDQKRRAEEAAKAPAAVDDDDTLTDPFNDDLIPEARPNYAQAELAASGGKKGGK